MRVLPGETALAFYTAKNLGKEDLIGIATYNMTPEKVSCGPGYGWGCLGSIVKGQGVHGLSGDEGGAAIGPNWLGVDPGRDRPREESLHSTPLQTDLTYR